MVTSTQWQTCFVSQDDKSRRRKRKSERSHKDSSSGSSVNSEGEEVILVSAERKTTPERIGIIQRSRFYFFSCWFNTSQIRVEYIKLSDFYE